ncbi:28S ribosomal protein S24, mitochondrial-like [Pecten maximus]|uniref:28S ribosomal protein S24, mitochondrial-like n=1 Tax=Pecten maximus TaxID=6579 RepID=UPI001457F2DB|nr:28S ribosomal protein S24, mitochondrial-like [Pecten maximus]
MAYASVLLSRVVHHDRLIQHCFNRCLQTSAIYQKNLRSAVPKTTVKRTVKLSYETAQYPYQIGVTKSWNSWHTSNLHEEGGASDAALEDEMIRKFLKGIWGNKLISECIIKRQYNKITLVFIASAMGRIKELNFLVGFTEELFSHIFKRPVKIEMQTFMQNDQTVFKWI